MASAHHPITTPTTTVITPRYGEALQWADELHRPQRRKGKQVPYISHLISVSALVWEDGGHEDQAIAALLHDAIEDACQSHASIAERFGVSVASIKENNGLRQDVIYIGQTLIIPEGSR